MKPQSNTEAAETVQTTGSPAVVQERLVRLLCDGRCAARHECQGEVKRVHILLGSKDWGRFNYCDEARAEDKRNGYTVLFENVWCSQCGNDFGEGEHGFSHCSDHSCCGSSESPENTDMKTGIELIAAERERQITAEGWAPEHDDTHTKGEMAAAAACYAYDYAEETRHGDPGTPRQISPQAWPWDESWWKPKDRMSRLVRAGALIAAEIDRLSRHNT